MHEQRDRSSHEHPLGKRLDRGMRLRDAYIVYSLITHPSRKRPSARPILVSLRIRGGDVLDDGETVTDSAHDTVTVSAERSRTRAFVPIGIPTPNARYVVIDSLGSGGMGEVVRAYDPKLRREVALKQVLADDYDEESQARLVREARAMARLSHPNVVAVHDVEVNGPIVTMVMEYVPGQTLKQWLAEFADKPRPWSVILDVFREAARGLAAAHAVGLVHRDFKPANVLLTVENGRPVQVKVTDFGLVKEAGVDEVEDRTNMQQPAVVPADEGERDTGATAPLTGAGSIMGTPRYMAPEQHFGTNVDARADQFAFCVALWEALTGELPHVGAEALQSKTQGPQPWPKTSPVPTPIVAAIERGLAPDPVERWPSIDALLEALAIDPVARWTTGRRIAVAGLVLVGVAGLWGGLSRNAALCTGAASELAEVWNDERRTQVESALLATQVTYAADTSERVGRTLDDYARAWIEQHTEACEATSVRGEQSAAAMDLRMGCLWRAKMDLRAAVGVLQTADATVVKKAAELVQGLPNLERCSEVGALEQDEAAVDDPQLAAKAQELRAQLAEARALLRAGRSKDAYERFEGLQPQAEALGYASLQAEVRLTGGKILQSLGRYDEAASALRSCLSMSMEHGKIRVAARAASELTFVLGSSLRHFEWAHWMADVALGLAKRLEDREVEADVRNGLAVTLSGQGRLADAEEQHRLALELAQDAFGDAHPRVAQSHNNLANVLWKQGRYADAEQRYRVALELWQKAVGAEHPHVAATHNNLGSVLLTQGRYAEAGEQIRIAIPLLHKTLGEEHPNVAKSHNNLGIVLLKQGKDVEAEQPFRVALRLMHKALGEGHPDVALLHNNLATVLRNQGKYAEAEQHLRHALEIGHKVLGEEHPDVAVSYANLGIVLRHQGRHAEAERQLRVALDVGHKVWESDHPYLALLHYNLGEVLVVQKRSTEALASYEQAWARARRPNIPIEQTAETAFALAKLLWALGKDRDRAVDLARQARVAIRGADVPNHDFVQAIERWLSEHSPGQR